MSCSVEHISHFRETLREECDVDRKSKDFIMFLATFDHIWYGNGHLFPDHAEKFREFFLEKWNEVKK